MIDLIDDLLVSCGGGGGRPPARICGWLAADLPRPSDRPITTLQSKRRFCMKAALFIFLKYRSGKQCLTGCSIQTLSSFHLQYKNVTGSSTDYEELPRDSGTRSSKLIKPLTTTHEDKQIFIMGALGAFRFRPRSESEAQSQRHLHPRIKRKVGLASSER
ncbi:hypothetical protein BCR43DRAFT_295769 [Syncephalastrum racemosum]|uniref:Uncharacterized protein n=1 Tax=Syncephalastrum racemosum TaxID=13706 RepID=A0A1X2H987_SYNRA|nr:hypothetical protein BCR43DRAFT_295769 [Syncephalastrum racemosum]